MLCDPSPYLAVEHSPTSVLKQPDPYPSLSERARPLSVDLVPASSRHARLLFLETASQERPGIGGGIIAGAGRCGNAMASYTADRHAGSVARAAGRRFGDAARANLPGEMVGGESRFGGCLTEREHRVLPELGSRRLVRPHRPRAAVRGWRLHSAATDQRPRAIARGAVGSRFGTGSHSPGSGSAGHRGAIRRRASCIHLALASMRLCLTSSYHVRPNWVKRARIIGGGGGLPGPLERRRREWGVASSDWRGTSPLARTGMRYHGNEVPRV